MIIPRLRCDWRDAGYPVTDGETSLDVCRGATVTRWSSVSPAMAPGSRVRRSMRLAGGVVAAADLVDEAPYTARAARAAEPHKAFCRLSASATKLSPPNMGASRKWMEPVIERPSATVRVAQGREVGLVPRRSDYDSLSWASRVAAAGSG